MISYKIKKIGRTLRTKKSGHLNEYLHKEIASYGQKVKWRKCINKNFRV